MHAMTGSWLIVKWAGVLILTVYSGLILFVLIRFRNDWQRLRAGLGLPIVFGNFIGLSLPWIFEDVVFTRVCRVVAILFYLVGIAILLRGLIEQNHQSLLKAES
jgi:hypothetical protein